MGRRKHARPQAGGKIARETAPAPAAVRRSPLATALVVVAVLGLIAGVLVLKLAPRAVPGPAAHAAAEIPDVPDPRTDDMVAPVRRVLTAAREAVVAAPGSAEAWGELAMLCDAHHLYSDAEICYRAARALAPSEFRWAYGLAVVRDYMGAEASELAGLFGAALELSPRYPPARLRHGSALVRQGDLPAARAAFEQALALDPDFAMAHRSLGQTLLSLDDVDGAITHLERAAALDPSDGVVQSSLSQAYFRAGDAARAERAAEVAQEKAPVHGVPDPVRFAIDEKNLSPLACGRRANEREHRGEWSAALPDLERLVEITPEDASLQARLGRCLRRAGEAERARAVLQRALELSPDQALALLELAELERERGDLHAAVALYRRTVAAAPQSALAWNRLGTCLGELDDLAGALAVFESAGETLAADAELLHNWGMVLCRLGRQREACERLRSALALEPNSGGTHFVLAASLETLGEREEAIEHYERALALDPALPSAERLAVLRAP